MIWTYRKAVFKVAKQSKRFNRQINKSMTSTNFFRKHVYFAVSRGEKSHHPLFESHVNNTLTQRRSCGIFSFDSRPRSIDHNES